MLDRRIAAAVAKGLARSSSLRRGKQRAHRSHRDRRYQRRGRPHGDSPSRRLERRGDCQGGSLGEEPEHSVIGASPPAISEEQGGKPNRKADEARRLGDDVAMAAAPGMAVVLRLLLLLLLLLKLA